MALDNYTNLKAELERWSARADLTTDIDTFIDMFEAWVNRNMRVRQMENEAYATVAEYIELPADFLELRDIQVMTNPRRQLQYVTPEYADLVNADGTSGQPNFYTLVGNQLRVVPSPSESAQVRISYWQAVPALDGTTTTNWLLTDWPDAYVWGPLYHARAFVPDAAMAEFFLSNWKTTMAEMQSAGKKSNLGGALAIRVA